MKGAILQSIAYIVELTMLYESRLGERVRTDGAKFGGANLPQAMREKSIMICLQTRFPFALDHLTIRSDLPCIYSIYDVCMVLWHYSCLPRFKPSSDLKALLKVLK